jgi:phosphatidyl-myo-inositol alpha-mannosyltransferase
VPEPLRIALVSPNAWPARDDVARHVEDLAAALARRGHRVTILAPGSGRERLADGRARLLALEGGDREALLAAPDRMLVVAVGRALPAGPGRRVAGPLDLATNLETALTLTPFDVVHLHEPLAAGPALAALRHATGVTAATFHRVDQLAGVAFIRPLVDRALARVDLRAAASEAARRALAEILPGRYDLMPGGVDVGRFAPPSAEPEGPPGLVVIARGRDRTGVRFALRALRGLDLERVGSITVLGAAEAPWRTRAAVPKVLRGVVKAVADSGPEARAAALARGRIALVATPDDVAGPAVVEAMACGMTVLAPRCPELDEIMDHGREGLALPPFSRSAWAGAVASVAADPERRAELGGAAAARARAWSWDAAAAEAETRYRDAIVARSAEARVRRSAAPERILADLRVRMGPALGPEALIAACRVRGIGAVAVAAPGGIGEALATARAAPPGLAVIVGQEIATPQGVIVGLFLEEAVEDGLSLHLALGRVRAQGGLVMVPHPAASEAPPAALLRLHAADVACYEVLSGASPATGFGEDVARLSQRLGILGCAGSGARTPEEVGAACARMRAFDGRDDFLSALAEAELTRRRRGLLQRPPRERRPPRRP